MARHRGAVVVATKPVAEEEAAERGVGQMAEQAEAVERRQRAGLIPAPMEVNPATTLPAETGQTVQEAVLSEARAATRPGAAREEERGAALVAERIAVVV